MTHQEIYYIHLDQSGSERVHAGVCGIKMIHICLFTHVSVFIDTCVYTSNYNTIPLCNPMAFLCLQAILHGLI